MIIRRFFYLWLFPSAFVLPLWVLLGWGFFHPGGGWSLLGVLVLCPIIFVAALLVAIIIVVRPRVRRTRCVSWLDAFLLALWNASVIAFGFFPENSTGLIAVLGIVVFVILFWSAVGQLVARTRGASASTGTPIVIIAPESPQTGEKKFFTKPE